ncbi:MAG: hypothetical protein HY318_02965 [Armatimonadetes bacterium]|nr:hypothetical protein [Armatimonadota bacterium]
MKQLVGLVAGLLLCMLGMVRADTFIISRDGSFLGNLNCNRYDPKSVSNPYGTYGSQYSPQSTNNPYGTYGSRYSTYSATNPYATQPPMVIESNQGYLGNYTANRYNNSVASPCNRGDTTLYPSVGWSSPLTPCVPNPFSTKQWFPAR